MKSMLYSVSVFNHNDHNSNERGYCGRSIRITYIHIFHYQSNSYTFINPG